LKGKPYCRFHFKIILSHNEIIIHIINNPLNYYSNMIKNITFFILVGIFCFSWKNSYNNTLFLLNENLIACQSDTLQTEKIEIDNWLLEFEPFEMVKIGPKREFKTLSEYFENVEEARNVHIVIDDGTYYDERIFVRAEYVVIEGTGKGVNLFCTEFGENVMVIQGNNIHVKNIHMKHMKPGYPESLSCTGHVIMFDNARNIIIENCNLNGCGLSGLHDNGGNSNILVKNCYIHNNSIGAYTNGYGNIWLNEINKHPIFSFENNRIENNGPNRIKESSDIDEFIQNSSKRNKMEERYIVENDSIIWKDISNPLIVKYTGMEWGDYFHIIFEDINGTEYDFGFGNNNYGDYILYDDETYFDNPKFLNQTFKLYWEWKLSVFPCCNGEYKQVEGYKPSIIKMELIELNLK